MIVIIFRAYGLDLSAFNRAPSARVEFPGLPGDSRAQAEYEEDRKSPNRFR